MIYVKLSKASVNTSGIPGIIPMCEIYVVKDENSEILLVKEESIEIPENCKKVDGLFTYIPSEKTIIDSFGNTVDLNSLI